MRQSSSLRWALCVLGLVMMLGPAHEGIASPHKNKPGTHHKARLTHSKKSVPPYAPAAAKSEAVPAPADDAAEPVEAVEAVEPVDAVAPAQAVQPSAAGDDAVAPAAAVSPAPRTWRTRAITLLGHLHAAVVHLPIAWVLLWVVFDVGGLWLKQAQLLPCGPWLGALATLSFVPAAMSGLVRFEELAQAAADAHTMDPALVHRNLMWAAWAMCGAALVLRRKAGGDDATLMRVAYTVWLIACILVVGYSAHLGGALVYGDEFLTF